MTRPYRGCATPTAATRAAGHTPLAARRPVVADTTPPASACSHPAPAGHTDHITPRPRRTEGPRPPPDTKASASSTSPHALWGRDRPRDGRDRGVDKCALCRGLCGAGPCALGKRWSNWQQTMTRCMTTCSPTSFAGRATAARPTLSAGRRARRRRIYAQATQAWERLYAAWSSLSSPRRRTSPRAPGKSHPRAHCRPSQEGTPRADALRRGPGFPGRGEVVS